MKHPAACGLLAAALAAPLGTSHAALDVAGLDQSVSPCADFYMYANKKWIDATPIPADRAAWGPGQELDQRNEKLLLTAIEQELKTPSGQRKYARGTPEWMAIQYYASGMDKGVIAKHRYRPLLPLFERAGAVDSAAALARTLGYLHTKGIAAGFSFSVDADRKDSTRYLAEISQGGLGLPDRDYYFLDDERSKGVREKYRKHVARMFELLDDTPDVAARSADTVVALETELARASMTASERRDVDKTYNKESIAELTSAAPGFPWAEYFSALGAAGVEQVNVAQPAFFAAFARLAQERTADWKAYLRWQIIHAGADKLPPAFEDANFDFYERELKGVQTPPPRSRRVLKIIGGPYGAQGVGMALGRIFVGEAFPPAAKARALELVNNLKAALRERLKTAAWMSDETRLVSIEKLAAMDIKIGYPDAWREYGNAQIGRGLFLENWLTSNNLDLQRDVARIGKTVDRSEWFISPHIVNAYYNPSANEIVFPAAILQPPFFDARADDALNYGAIGMVIGHEITHGFDDRGRRFDKDGNLRDWWTAEDGQRYNERARVIEQQYGSYDGVDGVKPNGTLTLGENISDIGGLKIAYDALQKAGKGKPPARIDGLTPQQRFFLSYAQIWRITMRAEMERRLLLTDPHSLPRLRVRGPLAHMPEFARAFSCDATKTVMPESVKSAIW